jgi:hypothetical protein
MEQEKMSNIRIERAILTALIENLGAAGFKVAAVYTSEDYQLADGESSETGGEAVKKLMTLIEVMKVFDDFDMYNPTVHFTHQHAMTWGNRGVMVVPGNGEDFISDWHCGDKAFDAIVDTVAEAAHEGALSLFVVPADIEAAIEKAVQS